MAAADGPYPEALGLGCGEALAGEPDSQPIERTRPMARRVPGSRLERLGRFGMLAGSLAAGALGEAGRRLMSGPIGSYSDIILTARNGQQFASALAGMRGAALKLGQLLSLEGGVAIPERFAETLERLRDQADTMPRAQLHRVLGREYGKGWERFFRHFEQDPVASASIGQVHRAVSTDGRELALKIQFPAVARSIDGDVDNMALLLRATGLLPRGYDIEPMLRLVKKQLRQETDYLAEAQSLLRYADSIAGDEGLRVPRPHPDLTTKRILAMDFVHADPIAVLWKRPYPQSERDRVACLLQTLTYKELFVSGFMQSDPNFANFLYDPVTRDVVLLDFGSTVEIDPSLRARYRRIIETGSRANMEQIAALVREYGWVEPGDPEEAVYGLADLIRVSCEPLRTTGMYDFGRCDLARRVRDISFDLTFRVGFKRPPPPDMLFIQRKLAGIYQLSTRLRARVESSGIAERFLG